jgi:hypothetical protein
LCHWFIYHVFTHWWFYQMFIAIQYVIPCRQLECHKKWPTLVCNYHLQPNISMGKTLVSHHLFLLTILWWIFYGEISCMGCVVNGTFKIRIPLKDCPIYIYNFIHYKKSQLFTRFNLTKVFTLTKKCARIH